MSVDAQMIEDIPNTPNTDPEIKKYAVNIQNVIEMRESAGYAISSLRSVMKDYVKERNIKIEIDHLNIQEVLALALEWKRVKETP